MASKPNIGRGNIKRLRLDQTGEVWVNILKDGQPADLTNRTFAFEYAVRALTGSRVDSALLIENSGVRRHPTVAHRIGLWLTQAQRDALTEDKYLLYLHESTSGFRDPRWTWEFDWLAEPENYLEGVPVEPAILEINFRTDPATIEGFEVLEGPPGDNGITPLGTLAAIATLPGNHIGLTTDDGGRAFLRIGTELFELNLTKYNP